MNTCAYVLTQYTHACVCILMTYVYISKSSNEGPQDMPLWHVVYFDLKTIKTQQFQEKLLLLS